jgi:hypothetical protein
MAWLHGRRPERKELDEKKMVSYSSAVEAQQRQYRACRCNILYNSLSRGT